MSAGSRVVTPDVSSLPEAKELNFVMKQKALVLRLSYMYLDAFIVIDRILGEGWGGKEVVCEVRKGAWVDRA